MKNEQTEETLRKDIKQVTVTVGMCGLIDGVRLSHCIFTSQSYHQNGTSSITHSSVVSVCELMIKISKRCLMCFALSSVHHDAQPIYGAAFTATTTYMIYNFRNVNLIQNANYTKYKQ